MSLRFAFLVAFVLFVATPSLESIGARAIRVATRVECYKACSAARTGNEAVLLGFNNAGVYLCHCVCPGLNGGGPLHAAVKSGCGHCFHLLTIGGGKCRCDDRDYFGNTPLHLAASLCFDPMTNRAITAKCNVDLKNYFGFTPLCLVSRRTSGSECGRVVRVNNPLCSSMHFDELVSNCSLYWAMDQQAHVFAALEEKHVIFVAFLALATFWNKTKLAPVIKFFSFTLLSP
eukprot:g377.t1